MSIHRFNVSFRVHSFLWQFCYGFFSFFVPQISCHLLNAYNYACELRMRTCCFVYRILSFIRFDNRPGKRRAGISPEVCHRIVSDSIDWFRACAQQYGMDKCVDYNIDSPITYYSQYSGVNETSWTPRFKVGNEIMHASKRHDVYVVTRSNAQLVCASVGILA